VKDRNQMSRKNFEKFSTMPLQEGIRSSIVALGFDTATPIQQLVLPDALKGRDILGQAQTGTGKTLAFIIPILESIDAKKKFVQAFVLTPTRELTKQVAGEIKKLSKGSATRVVSVYGGVSMKSQVNALCRGSQVVVGTPGRVLDLIRQKKLKLGRTKIAVLDEVDEMLDMGFYEEVEEIFSSLPGERQTMFFSATIPPRIQRLGRAYLKRPAMHSTCDDENRVADTTEHVFYEILDKERFDRLCDIIDAESVRLGLVFCRTKMETERVYRNLCRRGYKAESLHGNLPQTKREEVMHKYRSGNLDLLVATNVAARGIDVQGVSHVINYHIPLDVEVYVHRTGRTGRAGSSGRSITFVSPSEYYDLLKIQEGNNLDIVKRELPDKNVVFEKRMERMLDKLKEKIQGENVRDAYKMVKKVIPFSLRGRALAFLVKKYMDNGYNFLQEDEKGRRGGTASSVRLFINIGKNHDVSAAVLTDFLVKKGKLKEEELIKLIVLDKYSFASVKAGCDKKLMRNLSGKKIGRYAVNIEESREKRGAAGPRDRRPASGTRRRSTMKTGKGSSK